MQGRIRLEDDYAEIGEAARLLLSAGRLRESQGDLFGGGIGTGNRDGGSGDARLDRTSRDAATRWVPLRN